MVWLINKYILTTEKKMLIFFLANDSRTLWFLEENHLYTQNEYY